MALRARAAADRLEDAETIDIDIYDVIGDFWGEGVAAKDVLDKLKSAKNASTINVRINSGGGDAYDGLAIYNLLAQHKARVVVEIDGLAASAASLIAMAGDEIRMSEAALMMVHNPWSCAVGEAKDFREKAEQLDKLRDALANIYIRRTGLSRERVIELLDAETWMNADEAVELGFATDVTPAKQAAAMLRSEIDLSRFPRLAGERAELASRIARSAAPAQRLEVQITSAGRTADELAAVIRKETERVLAAQGRSQETNPPAPTEPPKTTKENPMTTPNASIAAALGLPVGATENDVLAACARMRNLEVEVCAITGAESSSTALGKVRALKEKADGADKLKADLDKVTGERDQQNFDALVQRGQSHPVKLTPATAKLYQDRFATAVAQGRGADIVAELKGFLDVAPTIIATPQRAPEQQNTGSAGQSLAWNGKTYDQMTYIERARLSEEQPELWRAMKDAFDAQAA